MVAAIHGVPCIVIDYERDNFAEETNPLGSPAKDELVDESDGRLRCYERDGEPDCHTGYTTESHGQEQEKAGVFFCPFKQVNVVGAVCRLFGQDEEQSSSDSKMGYINMDGRDKGDPEAAGQSRELPDGVFHDLAPPLT